LGRPEGLPAGAPITGDDDRWGRALFNGRCRRLPVRRQAVDKKELSAIVNDLAERYPKVAVAASLDALKESGFHWPRVRASRCPSRTS
jgi:DNA-directed RNA polymerase subunit beta'